VGLEMYIALAITTKAMITVSKKKMYIALREE
jgi:hypothetical protein